jgi:spoIIIJ-associated protein
MAKSKDPKIIIQKAAEDLLDQLQVVGSISVDPIEEGFQVNIASEESGLLIGGHGETLSSLQLILGIIIYRELGEWIRVIVEIGDYRARRNETLTAMAEDYAQRALTSGMPLTLPPMSAIERRVVHLALQNRSDVETYSEGEGRMRHIIIKPKIS